MLLKSNRTWSQQQLAIKLRLQQTKRPWILSWEHQRLLIHAAKTALAAGLCWALALQFGLHDGYWGAISAIIVLQSNVGSTVTASRDRLLGTLIGALLGFSFSLFGTLPWNYILAVAAAVVVCGLLGLRSSSRLAGVTITIVMLVQKVGSPRDLALLRVGQVVLGIVVALAVTTLVLPDRASGCRTDWPRSFWCWGPCSRQFWRAFAAHRPRIFPPCAKIPWPCCAATTSSCRQRAMSPPGGQAGARA